MAGKWVRVAGVLAVLLAVTSLGRANETDQFTLPVGKEFVDLGPYFSEVHYRVLSAVVHDLNRGIDAAWKISDAAERRAEINRLHDPGTIADAIRGKFNPGFFDMMDVETMLKSPQAQAAFPGKILLHEPVNWIYFYTHLPFDPRKLVLLFPAGTIKAYGVYFGTDKIGHFHDLGHLYYKDFLARRANGQSEEQALREVVAAWSKGLISEGGAIGNFAAGVYSNGDLAANYMGFKFYRQVTESVLLQGRVFPPLLVRDGERWKLNAQVGPDNDFLKPYFSDHLNEALNPCVYELEVRWGVQNRLRDLADNVLDFYRDEKGRRRPRSWFDNKVRETWTYYGEDYGHSRGADNLVTIGNTCFPTQSALPSVAHKPE